MTEETLSFDVMQIMEMIPHRYPFLLVDRITDLSICFGSRIGRYKGIAG